MSTADSIETDGILDTYPYLFRETGGSRHGSGALFETEGFVESPTLIFPSPYERYVQPVDCFLFLGDVKITLKRLAGVEVTHPAGNDVPVWQTSSNANPQQRFYPTKGSRAMGPKTKVKEGEMESVAAVAVPLVELHPAPWNPRSITEGRFQNLCDSIQADPDFLWCHPVLAQADGTIYAGNMRYRAAQALGMETVPAVVEDVSDRLARERALRDNAQWGEWEED